MTMISRSLRAFVAVAEELHFGRAAQRLHISQPPLSQQIRQFEAEVGTALFVRTTRSVRLTPAGKLMLERAHQLLEEAGAALDAVRSVAKGDTGSLCLGFSHSTVYGVLPRLLMAWRERYPAVALDLKQFTSNLLLEDVRLGRIDVALLRMSASMMEEDFEVRVVARDPMVLLLPHGHPLSALDVVPAQALEGLPFIGYAPGGARYFHELIETIFAAAGIRPRIVHTSILPTLLALVEARMGVALAPASVVSARENQVVCRPLSGAGDAAVAILSCAWRRDNTNPTVPAFVAMLPGAN